jgi:flavin prenyltransferase
MEPLQRLIVGISGASGITYAVRTLELLRLLDVETHLIISQGGNRTRAAETELSAEQVRSLADVSYNFRDIGAAIASHANASNLLTRAADVFLKERRRLVLMTRETPLHIGHLRNMLAVTEAGAIVMPPAPAFYLKPRTIDEIVHHTVARMLDLFGLDAALARWGEGTRDTNIEQQSSETQA